MKNLKIVKAIKKINYNIIGKELADLISEKTGLKYTNTKLLYQYNHEMKERRYLTWVWHWTKYQTLSGENVSLEERKQKIFNNKGMTDSTYYIKIKKIKKLLGIQKVNERLVYWTDDNMSGTLEIVVGKKYNKLLPIALRDLHKIGIVQFIQWYCPRESCSSKMKKERLGRTYDLANFAKGETYEYAENDYFVCKKCANEMITAFDNKDLEEKAKIAMIKNNLEDWAIYHIYKGKKNDKK